MTQDKYNTLDNSTQAHDTAEANLERIAQRHAQGTNKPLSERLVRDPLALYFGQEVKPEERTQRYERARAYAGTARIQKGRSQYYA